MTLRVTAGGATVTVQGEAVGETESFLERLASDGVPAALMSGNATLWGPDAAPVAARSLGWTDPGRRPPPELAALQERFAGLDRVVLAGTGPSALAAGVIAERLTVLDTADPHQVRRAMRELERTVLVVSGGETVEIDCLRRVFDRAFRDAGIDPAERIVVLADPGSSLAAGYTAVPPDTQVGGRYGALTASALAPAALCGADVGALLDQAANLTPALRLAYDNPGLALGAALGAAYLSGRDRLLIAEDGSLPGGLSGWLEQLLAASTGRDGKGILPVVVEGPAAPGFGRTDGVRRLVLGERAEGVGLAVSGSLGALFLLCEYATAVAARVIGVNPFEERSESRSTTAALLRGAEDGTAPTLITGEPALVDGDVEVHGDPELLDGVTDVPGALDALAGATPDRGYLAVTAYLDRHGDAAATALRPALARRAGTPQVTFGWGSRFLHSIGPYHKDGPPTGAFLQITAEATDDVPVPGRPFGLAALQLAQAFGDLRALRARGRPVLRLHLRDRAAGLARLRGALGG